jgi:hypothetical protein
MLRLTVLGDHRTFCRVLGTVLPGLICVNHRAISLMHS